MIFTMKRVIFNGSRSSIKYSEMFQMFAPLLTRIETKNFLVTPFFICQFRELTVGAPFLFAQRPEKPPCNMMFGCGAIDGGVGASKVYKDPDWADKLEIELVGVDVITTGPTDDPIQLFPYESNKKANAFFFHLAEEMNERLMPPGKEFEAWLKDQLSLSPDETDLKLQVLEDSRDLSPPQLIHNAVETLNTCS
ncbi:hypothetical protein [Vibrio quintilis]|uniref:Uncharacterized protein n=1 Tax=Vibrio quintilis TaxID=1117707 RepID=A0A1M7YP49_9VIBR|nr:hypothetical protein [Vibrio quintilis]SHO54379.1 hypothetical protein VQ7734_00093 [Vibrio quintilis]